MLEIPPAPGLRAIAAGGLGHCLFEVAQAILVTNYAATGSSTMSRVRDGSTLTPGPIVDAKVTERM